jgi:cytochrome b561
MVMQPVSPAATRYDTTTILFHWLTALLVATQWLGAQMIDWFPRGPLCVDAQAVHITCGLALGVILLLRIVWSHSYGRQLPPAGSRFVDTLAKLVHKGLYLLVGAMVLVGVALTLARGADIFGLYSIPSLAPGNKALVDQIAGIHDAIGWIIIGVVGLHAVAALFHQYIWKDGVMDRMGLLNR